VKISITARHLDLTPSLRQFTEQRLEKLHRFAPDIHGAHVVLSQQRAACLAEVTVRVNGTEFVSSHGHAEAGAALERAIDRLEEQLRRHKDRRVTKKQRPTRPLNGAAPPSDDLEAPEEE